MDHLKLTFPQPDINSTPWSDTCVSLTQIPGFLPTVDNIDRFLLGDLKWQQVVDFDKFLIGLGANEGEINGTEKDEAIEKILEDGTVLQLFEAYCQPVSGEQERYGPFCELVNHCMSLLGIRSLLFTRNDPKYIRGVRASRRKPDVVAVDSTNPFVADGRWKSHSRQGPKVAVPLTFEELKFVFEFKLRASRILIQDNVVKKLEKLFASYPSFEKVPDCAGSSSSPSHPLTKSQGKTPTAKGGPSLSKRPVKHKKLQGQVESSSSAKKRMQKEADLENNHQNRKKKRFKADDWEVKATLTLRISGARYAADLLSYCSNRRHCIEGLVVDGVLFMTYYDRAGPLMSRSLNFIKDRYLFILLIKTLAKLSPADCGYLECMEGVSMQSLDNINMVDSLPSDDYHAEPCVVSPTLPLDSQSIGNDQSNLQGQALPPSDPLIRQKSIPDLAGVEHDVFGGSSPLSSQSCSEEMATPESGDGGADEASETVVSDFDRASLSKDISHRGTGAEGWEEQDEQDENEEEEGDSSDGDYVPSDEGNEAEDPKNKPKWRLKTRFHDFFLHHPLHKATPYGIVTRGGRVFLGKCATLDKSNPDRAYAVKMSWPHARRRPEHEVVALAREVLARRDSDADHKKEYGDRKLVDSLPKLFLSEDLDDLLKEGSFRQRVLGEEFRPLNRIWRVLAFEYLVPLYAVGNLEHFKQAVRDLVLAHHFLSISDKRILHRDISLGNLMVRIEGSNAWGVLNDWDLALVGDPAADQHIGARTGTRIYMSCDLFGNPPPLHLERFDWESFFYVIVWIASRYAAGEEVDNSALSDWHEPDDKKLRSTKHEVLFGYGNAPFMPLTSFYEPLRQPWIQPLQDMFRAGDDARRAFGFAMQKQPTNADMHRPTFDVASNNGQITWERFWKILQD